MFLVIVLAILSSLIYMNLMLTDAINAKINPYGTGKDEKQAILLSKIKYALLVIMALTWGTVIRFF